MFIRNLGTLTLLACFALPTGVWADNDHDVDDLTNVVYIQSNNPIAGRNAVIGYNRNPATGELTEMSGSPFLTGGTGFLNATEVLGPDDTDREIIVTPDHRFLYTVNEGSNTIAGFSIQSNGSLKAVPGSPFASGGVEPGSLTIFGAELFVVNRGDQAPAGFPAGGNHAPNYQGFLILPNGSLASLPWAQLTLGTAAAPTELLPAPNSRILFDTHLFEVPFNSTIFGLPFLPQAASVLHSYKLNLLGQLVPASQTAPAFPPIPPYILGLQVHPTKKILYVGLVVASTLGVYTYDDNGVMTFVGGTPGASDIGPSGLCWISISPDAKWLYTADAISDEIDVYSIGPDPLHPVLTQTVQLKGPKSPTPLLVTGTFFDTTPFQLTTSPDGKYLYVMNHEGVNNIAAGNANGNAVHILGVGATGQLTEIAHSPVILPVGEEPINGHPLGIVTF